MFFIVTILKCYFSCIIALQALQLFADNIIKKRFMKLLVAYTGSAEYHLSR